MHMIFSSSDNECRTLMAAQNGSKIGVHAIAGDVIGRTLRNAGRLQLTDTVLNANPPAGVTSITRSQFSLLPNENLNLLLGAVGVKANVTNTLLVTANLLFPLTNSGLRSKITPVIGFDYSF